MLPEIFTEKINSYDLDLLNGYIKFLTENEIIFVNQQLKNLNYWKNGEAFARTAFGDIFAWEDEKYIALYKLKDNEKKIILSGSKFFFQNIDDLRYQKDFFELDLFNSSIKKIGKLESNECLIFSPLPFMGGEKTTEKVSKGKFKEYLAIIIQML